MNKVFISFEQNTKKLQWTVLACFISLLLYGLYKNGFSYYFQGLISFSEASKLFLFPIISVAFLCLYECVENQKIQFSLSRVMEGILLALLIPTRFPIWCYVIMIIVYIILKKIL